jgi:serine/threonine-protein kinase
MSGSSQSRRSRGTPTPGVAIFTTAPRRGLPPDILREASRRLGHAALLYSAVYFLAYFGAHLLSPGGWELFGDFRSAVAIVAVVAGIAVYALTRYGNLGPEQVLDFGLLFEVAGAFGIAVVNVWGAYSGAGQFDAWLGDVYGFRAIVGIPWECAWIIIFPLVAPNTPGKILLASLAAASMGPLAFVLSKSVGATSPDVPMSSILAYYATSTYLCAGIAFVISRGFYRFGRRLQKAQEVGSYRISGRLGAGGMGEVWRAEHRMLARPAAIKLIRPEALGVDEANRRTVIRRFEREARSTAALRSKHTIELYDFGVTEEGAFYYVMELLDGLSLKDLVAKFGPVPAGRAVHVLRQVCHSLGEAHSRGMIHRDIKPANIFACRLGPDVDFVKVLDFGLVKASEAEGPGATELTAEGVVAGTPAFMAPEMAAGPAVDSRADIYALGCVGYWLLTGQPVFEADTPLTTVLQHVQATPVPPSSRTEIEIPPTLEELILTCLEKDPASRPADAEELDRRLEATGLALEWGPDRAREWWQLHMVEPSGDSESGVSEAHASPADVSPARPSQ